METIEVNGKKYEAYGVSYEHSDNILFNGKWYKPIEEKPKDWEILSFKSKVNGELRTLREDGLYYFPEHCINQTGYCSFTFINDEWPIYSVKRLSDNEVFTVGETTEGNNIIASFKIENNIIRVRMEDEIGGWWTNLASLTKAKKQPLFTTVDNVPVYHGETFFGISKYCDTGEWKDVTKWSADQRNNYEDEYIKTRVFSKKENAEKALKEWQLFNKPLLSLKEIKSVIGHPFIDVDEYMDELKVLAKTKI